jgi:hypothetical protein
MQHWRGFIFIIIFIFSSKFAYAREVDQFMAWGNELSDSTPILNQWTQTQLQQGLMTVNGLIQNHKILGKKYLQCEHAAYKMMRVFYRFSYQTIEEYVDKDAAIDRFPKNEDVSNFQYIRKSIIEIMPFLVPMSRIININGIYVGSDKFGHFTSFGNRYYKKYLRLIKKGHTDLEATKKVLLFGLKSEQGVVGKMTSQVSSYGDYEANYQGLVFIKSLCQESSEVRLTWSDQGWKLVGNFDWRQYINPDMDESFNNSTFSKLRWRDIRKNMLPYCPMLESDWVKDKFAYYRSIYKPSLAKLLQPDIEHSIKKIVPQTSHSLFSICSDFNDSKD